MADADCSSAIPRQAWEQDSFEAPSQVRGQAQRQHGGKHRDKHRNKPVPALDAGSQKTGGIGHPQRAVRLYFRPKLVSVKRRDRSERPERLLFERSEFQTRQRTEGTE